MCTDVTGARQQCEDGHFTALTQGDKGILVYFWHRRKLTGNYVLYIGGDVTEWRVVYRPDNRYKLFLFCNSLRSFNEKLNTVLNVVTTVLCTMYGKLFLTNDAIY